MGLLLNAFFEWDTKVAIIQFTKKLHNMLVLNGRENINFYIYSI